MRIGFDIDGVFANFTEAFFGQQPQDVTEWDNGLKKEEVAAIWGRVVQTQNWWMRLNPLVDQEEINAVNFLIRNHDVYFITSRRRTLGLTAESQSKYWLSGIGIDTDHATVIATKSGTKGELCRALDIDYFLDDRVKELLSIHNDSKETTPCLRSWPYNESKHFPWGFSSVKEFIEWVIKDGRSDTNKDTGKSIS